MKLRKKEQSIGILGKILNALSSSNKDTYSCNYINNQLKDVYSAEEVKTNKVWFGKPVYRKVIDFGNLPNNNYKTINHGIENIDEFVVINAIGKNTTKNFYPIPFVGNPSMFSGVTATIRISETQLTISTTSDISTHTAIVILEYTKTTD